MTSVVPPSETLAQEPRSLTLTPARGAHWARHLTWVAFVSWSVVIAYGSVVILRPIPNWWQAEPGWLDIVVAVTFQPLAWLWFFLWLDDRTPQAARLTPGGIELRDKRGRTVILHWKDPKFTLMLRVGRAATDSPKATIVWGGRLIPGSGVTAESAAEILRVARAHQLDVEDWELGWGRWRTKTIRIHPYRSGPAGLRNSAP